MKATSVKQAVMLLALGLVFGAALLNTQCTSKPPAPAEPGAKRTEVAAAPGCAPVTYTIDPNSNPAPWVPPTDINVPGGAASASLKDAAIFAWQEFIALNWPAVPQTGQPNTRDQPDPAAKFAASTTGPLVWHTYRHKVEIFPGMGNPPGYPGSNGDPSYGYDALPQYIYAANSDPNNGGIIPANGQIPAFSSLSGPTPTPTSTPTTPWINLDEQSEIGLDTMFAGTLTSPSPTPGSTPVPFPGQQILFLAKANRAEYTYVAANKWWDGSAPYDATIKYIAGFANNPSAYVNPPPGGTQYVSLPNNTIEVKSAWRQLTAKEAGSGRFYTTTVRFYNQNNSSQVGYIDAVWGMVALHIIQKTPSAPYFIYATFSQADNLLDADGNYVEDTNGNLVKNQGADPLDPNVTSVPASTPVSAQTVQKLSPPTSPQTLQTVGQRLFYINTPTDPAPPPTTQGLVALNRREHNIPPCIIDVNTAVHTAITNYGNQNNNGNPVWLYYKLVNVQYQPYDKPPGTIYTGAPGGPDPSTYYQANEVVETDYNLQVFSGQFQLPLPTPSPAPSPYQSPNVNKLITDYNLDGTPFKNVYYSTSAPNSGKAANMGGCMGCHGNAQVAKGSDFSFILRFGRVSAPDVASGVTQAPSPTGFAKFSKLLLRQ